MFQKQPYTRLANGVNMPLIGMGAWDMYGRQAEKAVMEAIEIGYRLFDTASMYGNETDIGRAIRRSKVPREELFITTKVNNVDQGFDNTLMGFDKSVKKLGLEFVDLYLVHWPLKATRRTTWLALEKLYLDKKIRAIGVANYTQPFLDELSGYASIIPMVDQIEFTPWLFQKSLLEYSREMHIQIQAYSPLARGRKLDDPRLLTLAKKLGRTPVQVVLAWHLAHGVSAIPKSSSRERLMENFESTTIELSPKDVEVIDGFNQDFRVCDDPQVML
ncbi:MAG TPA: aldo/keto reductase [Puia sp.]|nr:aldo/keto reductase [Puia sp.]